MIVDILQQDIIVNIIDDDTVWVSLVNTNPQQQSAIEFQDEGVTLGTVGTVNKINFVGSSVVASRSGSTVTITITGGGGGTPGGSSGQIQYNNAGSFGGFGSWDGTTFALGTLGYSDTGIVASFQSSTNSYNQVVLQNTSSGASASTNFNVSNNSGTSTTNFGEFGINSSGFTGTGSFSQPGYVYLAAASTDLVIGTYGNMPIHFTVNSGSTDAMLINASGNISIGAQTDTAKLYIAMSGLNVSATDASGLFLKNTSTAISGTQQISPVITLTGSGHKINATAGPQAVSYQIYTLPVQGAAAPSASLVFGYSINGGAYSAGWVMSDLIGATGNGYTAFYDKGVTPSATNFNLASIANAAFTRLNAVGQCQIAVAGTVGFEVVTAQSNCIKNLYIGGAVGSSSGATAFATIVAGTTAQAQLRFIQGVAPTSPNDGDVWREDNTNTGWKIRINGITKTISVV